jgi:hypothetical protein
MKQFLRAAACLLAFTIPNFAAELKWTGVRFPVKISAGDGITTLGTKIGKFVVLSNNVEAAQAIFNVHNRFPASTPWATLAVGEVPDAPTQTAEDHENFLISMDRLGVDIFLEIFPSKKSKTDVPAAINFWLAKFKRHKSVKGLCVDLEYYNKADDTSSKSWDEAIKSHNPKYRMMLKHWDQNYMPPTYRGKSDIIFVNNSSEATPEALSKEFVQWAAQFAPSACAFQIGYPSDEDGMNGKNDTGWWKMADPIKEWGSSLAKSIENSKQEIGIIWVCVKSGKTYNTKWDLTKGAGLPTVAP